MPRRSRAEKTGEHYATATEIGCVKKREAAGDRPLGIPADPLLRRFVQAVCRLDARYVDTDHAVSRSDESTDSAHRRT